MKFSEWYNKINDSHFVTWLMGFLAGSYFCMAGDAFALGLVGKAAIYTGVAVYMGWRSWDRINNPRKL